ncbi:MAG: preprotein translocase subunit SecG [Rubrivivax sp.]|nr:preprotein translocase subunit SecG [Rubrivivax sp.]MCW5612848.1 preprotein translocase subunit SecG [Rubrivivax sp.]
MQIWLTLILAVQLLAALAMIGLVLIQHGKGADMGASFGSGASGSLFGASGSANFLSRSTAALATVFFLCTLALAYMGSDISMGSREGGSVLDRPASAASEPATGAIPGAIPGAAPATAPATAPAAAPNAGTAASAPAAAIPAPSDAASR